MKKLFFLSFVLLLLATSTIRGDDGEKLPLVLSFWSALPFRVPSWFWVQGGWSTCHFLIAAALSSLLSPQSWPARRD
jgi:hypothetical protein